MSRALVVLVALVGCFRGGDPAAPAPVENVAPAPATLRIKRVAPRLGSIRVETTVTRGSGSDTRKVLRVAVLAVDGFAATKVKHMYLETTGRDAGLEGKSFVLTRVDDHVEVVPVDGTPVGDEAAVANANGELGEIDSTVLMVTNRDFVIGTPVRVDTPKELSLGSTTTLTLRSYDAATATFDFELEMPPPAAASVIGQMIVDRATGRENSASLTMKIPDGHMTRETTIDFQATTE